MHPESKSKCLYVGEKTLSEEGAVKTEAEAIVMYLQAKECQELQQPPEARREAWSRFSLRATRKNQLC